MKQLDNNNDNTKCNLLHSVLIFKFGTEQSHKLHDATVPCPTIHHSEQICAHVCSEWCIVGYGTCELWNL